MLHTLLHMKQGVAAMYNDVAGSMRYIPFLNSIE